MPVVRDGIVTPKAVHQMECFEAGILFARTEGIIPAPETTHAIRGAIIEAMKDPKEPKTILFNFSGTGLIDMPSYDNYLSGKLSDYAYPQEQIDAALARLPKVG
jgi:tryptophan synthase beta chain